MDYKRITLAAVVAWFVDLIYGLAVHTTVQGAELAKYPAIFRPENEISANFPLTFAGGLFAMFVLAYIYAKGYEGGNGVLEGMRFGVLLALFTVSFVLIDIYASVNISARTAAMGAARLVVEMIVVGAVIGALYRPAPRRNAAAVVIA